MTKKLALTIGVLLTVSVAVLLWFKLTGKAGEVRIGVALPLTGNMAEYGTNGKEGLTLALEELSRQPEMPKFTLLYQDTKETPQETVNAVRRLIDYEGVQYIIGGLTSSGVLAAAPYAQKQGVIFFSPAASAPGIPEIGNMIFRNWPGDDTISRQFGEAIYQSGVREIAILHVANDYGKTNADGFTAGFQAAGGKVILSRAFAQGSTDFKSLTVQLAGLPRKTKTFVIGYPDEYRSFFQELTNTTLSPDDILTSDTFYSPNLLAELGQLVNGVKCAVASKPGDDYQPRQAFISAYSARFQTPKGQPKQPGLVSDTAYDALKLLALAISQTGGEPAEVSDFLLAKIINYPGAIGPTSFTKEGDIQGEMSLYQVENGHFLPWTP